MVLVVLVVQVVLKVIRVQVVAMVVTVWVMVLRGSILAEAAPEAQLVQVVLLVQLEIQVL